jgi:hypothetical protein
LMLTMLKTVLPNAYNGYVNRGTGDGGQGTKKEIQGTGDEGRGTRGSTNTGTGAGMDSSDWSLVSSNTKYTEGQLVIINQLLSGINRVPVEAIGDFMVSMRKR